jgi:mannose-6-phosphate isomerase-like protein (cupin superfamily)
METPHEPIVLGPGEGRGFPFGRRTTITKVDEEDTQDVAIFESMPEPGVPAALPHRHWEADEAFYVLEGQVEFLVEERLVRGTSGTFVFIPRGVVHGFRNPGPGPAKMLVLIWPARGLRPVKELGALLAAGGPPDPEQIRAIFAVSHSEEVHDDSEQWR